MCRVERWSVRALRQQIDSMLYERTARSHSSGKPKAVVEAQLAALRAEGQVTTLLRDAHLAPSLGTKAGPGGALSRR